MRRVGNEAERVIRCGSGRGFGVGQERDSVYGKRIGSV